MAMNIPGSGGDEDQVLSTINTTPLVDVMLVMLIIFLITVPVIVPVRKVELPTPRNIAQQTKPEDIPLSVDSEGNIYLSGGRVPNREALFHLLADRSSAAYAAGRKPPQVHIRADQNARYEQVARVLYTIQTAGILEVAFLTEPKGNPTN
ncbi:MAG TPA: biopolymer transporter ExbD [Steroidobacteraceae bacterium]|nr:biopolymer transporter ExbD [Steroidobacteraceae bacterium]